MFVVVVVVVVGLSRVVLFQSLAFASKVLDESRIFHSALDFWNETKS
jgi:hypothetical protein